MVSSSTLKKGIRFSMQNEMKSDAEKTVQARERSCEGVDFCLEERVLKLRERNILMLALISYHNNMPPT